MTYTNAALLCALVFGIGQNICFGWNATPQSRPEEIADNITLVLFAIFLVVWLIEPKHHQPTTTIIITHERSASPQGERDGSSI